MSVPLLEAWTLPSSGTFQKVVGPIPYTNLSFNKRVNSVTNGRFTLPYGYARLNDIVDPGSNVETLIRVFEGGVNSYSFFARFMEVDSARGEIVVYGPSIASELDNVRQYPADWTPITSPNHQKREGSSVSGVSKFLDTVYAGTNIVSNPDFDRRLVNEVQTIYHNYFDTAQLASTITDSQTTITLSTTPSWPTSNFRIVIGNEFIDVGTRSGATLSGCTRGVDGSTASGHSVGAEAAGGGWFTLTFSGQTTGRLEWNATPEEIEDALILLSNIASVSVNGSGLAADDPWEIEFQDPGEDDVALLTATITNMTGGTDFVIEEEQKGGVGDIHPWTKSTNPNTRKIPANYAAFEVVSTDQGAYFAHSGTMSLRVECGPGSKNYPGPQQVVPVEPGGVYQASAWVYAEQYMDDGFAIVIRDLNNNQIAKKDFRWIAPTAWTQLTITDVKIPDGISHVIFRVAAVRPDEGDVFYFDDAEMLEGKTQANAGQIVHNFITECTGRGALSWLDVDTFDTINDSSGYPFGNGFPFIVKMGSSLLDVLNDLANRGYEWEVEWSDTPTPEYELRLYNQGNLGSTITSKQLAPHRITKAFIRKSAPAHNTLIGQGDEGLVDEVTDATLSSAYGRREGYVSDDGALRGDDLLSLLNNNLDLKKASKSTAKFSVDDSLVLGVDFNVGDSITAVYPNYLTSAVYRIANAMINVTVGDDIRVDRTVDVGKFVAREIFGGTTSTITSEIVNALVRQRREISKISTQLADVVGFAATTPAMIEDGTVAPSKLMLLSFDNLIANPGFESDIIGGPLDPHSYTGRGGTWSTGAGVPRSGGRAARFDVDAQTGSAAILFNGPQDIASHPSAAEGDQFYFEVYCRKAEGTTNPNARLIIQWVDETGTNISNTNGTSTTISFLSYTKLSVVGTAPAGTASVRFYFQVLTGGSADYALLVDDAYARRMIDDFIIDSLSASKITAGTIDTGEITVQSTLTMGTSGIIRTAASGARLELKTDHASNIRFFNASNVEQARIGWNQTDTRLEIDTRDYTSSDFRLTAGAAEILTESSVRLAGIGAGGATDVIFYVDGGASGVTERMVLMDAGRLGIGDSTPEACIDIDSVTNQLAAQFYRRTTTATDQILNLYSNIGGTGTNKWYVEANGDTLSATGIYGTISDAALKTGIVDAPSYWDDYLGVRWRKFQMVTGDGQTMLGPVAQELAEFFPGLVKETTIKSRKGPGVPALAVKTSVLHSVQGVVLQEAQRRIEDLERRVMELEGV